MKKRKISRKSQNTSRMNRNMVSSLFLYEQVKTTIAKARILKQEAQKVVSKINSATDDLNLQRYLKSYLYGGAVKKAIESKNTLNGVAVFRTAERFGDGSMMAVVSPIKAQANQQKVEKSITKKG
jgi:large subunit ribosomal protein L17